jgi:F-type H+-transporting ATPase subunit delta
MKVNLLAKRYAQAVFDLALETRQVEKTAQDLRLVKEVLEENRELRKLMANPVLDASKKIKVIHAIFGSHVNELSIRFMNLITRKGREDYLLAICVAFEEIFLEYKNILRAEFISASPANAAIKKAVIEKLAKITDKTIELDQTIDPEIIGGYILRMEDYQVDFSIKNQLRKLRKKFAENLYVKQF